MTDTVSQPSQPQADPQQTWQRRLQRNQPWVIAFGAVALLVFLYWAGAINALDRGMMGLRFGIAERPASGDIVIVALDQRSRAALKSDNVDRADHAAVIRALTNAGAKRIGMKFDFRGERDAAGDAALIYAAKQSGGRLVLPISTGPRGNTNAEILFNAPFGGLGDLVDLGSTRLRMESDGRIHEYRQVHAWRNTLISSFAGEVVENMSSDQATFLIDYGIDVHSIPRISYIDVLNDGLPADSLAGKYVFVGATDQVPGETLYVPVYETLSSVELHALAGEALHQDRLLLRLPSPTDLALAICIFIVLCRVFLSLDTGAGLIVASIITASLAGLGVFAQITYAVIFPVAATLLGIWMAFLVGWVSRSNDKSEDLFKRAFESSERGALMNAIISTNLEGIVVFDEQDRICLINPTAAQLLNWAEDTAIGRAREDILRIPDDVTLIADNGDHSNLVETTITRADGNELEVELTYAETVLAPTSNRFERRSRPRQYGIYAFRDVSSKNKAEAAMVEAAERAFQADRLKSEFIANMSHELRVPLNSIIGFSEVIKQELFGNLGSPHYKEYAQDIFASGTHLMSIIDDLLEVSKIASGKIELTDTEIDMERMFAECLQIVRGYPSASKKILSASMRPGCPNLIADKRAMKQILINLLSNAIKFTNEGGGVRLTASPSTDGGVELMVSDDGIGIPPEEMSRITEAFHQIDNPAHRKNAGTGLGLHIVQSLAELHGATVAVSSTVNSGTQVRVIFPPERNGHAANVIPLETKQKSG